MVANKWWRVLLVGAVLTLVSHAVGVTLCSNVDSETALANTFQGTTSPMWRQTTQTDFNAGVLINVDTASSPGDVKLAVRSNWYNASWSYRKPITIDYTKVSVTNQSNFAVLISQTDPNWKYTANGGYVGKSNGGDIVFTSSDGTTKLSHEIEKYDPTTGQLIAWVSVPILSASVNTIIYIYYGNASCADQWSISGTWDTNFKGVWHLKEDPSGTAP
jgi:hypothetical protein